MAASSNASADPGTPANGVPPKLLTLVLIHDKDNNRVLLGMKKRGFGAGKWNGFGGKVEVGESIAAGAHRELEEECGVKASHLTPRAVIVFEFEGGPKLLEVHLFTGDPSALSGEPVETEEMKPAWFAVEDVPFELMWPDDREWFPVLFRGDSFAAYYLFSGQDTILSGRNEAVDPELLRADDRGTAVLKRAHELRAEVLEELSIKEALRVQEEDTGNQISCPMCSLFNPPTATRCSACEGPLVSAASNTQACPVCTLEQPSSNARCDACGTILKPDAALPPAQFGRTAGGQGVHTGKTYSKGDRIFVSILQTEVIVTGAWPTAYAINHTALLPQGQSPQGAELFGRTPDCMVIALFEGQELFWKKQGITSPLDLRNDIEVRQIAPSLAGGMFELSQLILIANAYDCNIEVTYYATRELKQLDCPTDTIPFESASGNPDIPTCRIVLVERHYLNGGQSNI